MVNPYDNGNNKLIQRAIENPYLHTLRLAYGKMLYDILSFSKIIHLFISFSRSVMCVYVHTIYICWISLRNTNEQTYIYKAIFRMELQIFSKKLLDISYIYIYKTKPILLEYSWWWLKRDYTEVEEVEKVSFWSSSS